METSGLAEALSVWPILQLLILPISTLSRGWSLSFTLSENTPENKILSAFLRIRSERLSLQD